VDFFVALGVLLYKFDYYVSTSHRGFLEEIQAISEEI